MRRNERQNDANHTQKVKKKVRTERKREIFSCIRKGLRIVPAAFSSVTTHKVAPQAHRRPVPLPSDDEEPRQKFRSIPYT